MLSYIVHFGSNFIQKAALRTVRRWLALTFVVGLMSLATSVRADPESKREPERYAFVTGNGDYNANGSSMDDLLTACDEAIAFRKQLIALGWPPDHIYPLVKPKGSNGESDQVVRDAICDLKTGQLRDGLLKFSNLMLDTDSNPYGVVYFAGHGAQSDGNQYLFGVDAELNFGTELRRASAAPNYRVFADSAVNVLDIINRVSGVDGRAMLVIIDACRNNPVLDKYKADVAEAGKSDPELIARLSAGYLSQDSEASELTADFSNIVVLFSTRPLKEASGAPAGLKTQFSQVVMNVLSNPGAAQTNGSAFADTVISLSRQKQHALAKYDRQIPDRLGSMAFSPVFCFQGCAQPLNVWAHPKVKVIADLPVPGGPATAVSMPPMPVSLNETRPRILPASYQNTPTAIPTADAIARPLSLAPPPRSLNVDVFYCTGDDLAGQREQDANQYALRLRQAYPTSRLIQHYYVGRLRVVSLDPAAKPAVAAGKTGVSIWVDRGSGFEQDWAARFATLGSGIAIRENRRTATKEYVSVFFCGDRAKELTPVSTVYTQVSRAVDAPRAASLIAYLKAAVPGLNFIDKVDPVDDRYPGKIRTPTNTEVRYYHDDQYASAVAIADGLSKRLKFPATVKKTRLASKPANPVIEVWIGLDETAAWHVAKME